MIMMTVAVRSRGVSIAVCVDDRFGAGALLCHVHGLEAIRHGVPVLGRHIGQFALALFDFAMRNDELFLEGTRLLGLDLGLGCFLFGFAASFFRLGSL